MPTAANKRRRAVLTKITFSGDLQQTISFSNQFKEYNKRTDNVKEGIEKMKQMQFLMNNNSMPISSYYGNKSNFKKHVDMQNQPFSYIYLLNDNYSMSEKNIK